MVAREHYRSLFISTVILTTVVFVIGVFVGYWIDRSRTGDVVNTFRINELDAQSYQIEQEFFELFGEYSCELASRRLSEMAHDLGEIGYYLVGYEKNSLFQRDDYDYLLRKYFLMEVRTYTLFMNMKKSCKSDDIIILYFFDPEDQLSVRQGNVLDVLVKGYGNLSVFSLNTKYEGDLLVNSVKLHYNVTQAPTLIINDKQRIEGFATKDELEKIFGRS